MKSIIKNFTELKEQSCALKDYSVIKISGSDATSFLNSQSTNSVTKLSLNQFQMDALLDRSGKLVSYFFILRDAIDSYLLLTPSKLIEQTLSRINSFHISEDLTVTQVEQSFVIHFFTAKENSFKGEFGSIAASITKEDINTSELDSLPESLYTLCSVPLLDKTVMMGELINNTLLKELALDFKKGCFLGQETVSKIESRRGAAIAPVFLKSKKRMDFNFPQKITSLGQSIGEVRDVIELEGNYFYLSFLNRENRVLNKEIFIDYKTVNADEQWGLTTHVTPLVTLNSLVENLYQSAVIDFQGNNESLAIEKLSKIVEVEPSYYDAYESLGVIYGRQEKFDEAIKVMHALEKIAPKSVMAQTNLSMFYMKIGEIEKAEAHKSNATMNQFSAFGDIADEKRALKEQEKQKASELKRREDMFVQVLGIDPQDALATYGLGELRLSQGKLDEAQELLQTTIESDPKYSVAYLALAKTFIELDQKSKAKLILEKGIAVSSKNGDLMPANEMQSLLVNI